MMDIQPFGRQLLMLTFGRIAYQENMIKRNIALIQKETKNLRKAESDLSDLEEINRSVSITLLDKRFKESKQFISSGGVTPKNRFKRSASSDQIELQHVVEKNLIKAQISYSHKINTYNSMIMNKNMQAAMKRLSLD